MNTMPNMPAASDPAFWDTLVAQAQGLVDGEPDLIANCANLSALLFHALPAVNWVGVYLLKDGELVVGPFQGKPACVRIPLGRGVCGTAAAERRTVVVDDVAAFAGHITCDAAAQSEIVVPLIYGGTLFGVIDVDSPQTARFGDADRAGLERVAALLVPGLPQLVAPDEVEAIERFTVRAGDALRVFQIGDIDWIEADEYYVKLHIGKEVHMVRQTMGALEERLPADRFVRIHRSTIVNIDRIVELDPLFQGEFNVLLRDGTTLRMSRRRRGALENRLPSFS